MAIEKIGIVIPVLNQFQLAIEAIESVRTEHATRVYPMLNYRKERSLAASWNKGCLEAIDDGCTHILIINDDIIFSPNAVDEIKRQLDTNDDYVLVSAVNTRGHILPEQIYRMYPEQPSEIPLPENPDFACFMITPETLDIVGQFDEKFNPAYFEDNDYHRRVNLSGNKAGCATAAPYYHYGSQTQNANPVFPVVPSFVFEINKAYYVSKWGGEVGKETYTTPFNDPELSWRDW